MPTTRKTATTVLKKRVMLSPKMKDLRKTAGPHSAPSEKKVKKKVKAMLTAIEKLIRTYLKPKGSKK
jgi:hypothetical protein